MVTRASPLDENGFRLMLTLDRLFEEEGELFRTCPAVFWPRPDETELAHWHRHVSGRFMELKKPKLINERLDALFLCSDLVYVFGKVKLHNPGLFYYLN